MKTKFLAFFLLTLFAVITIGPAVMPSYVHESYFVDGEEETTQESLIEFFKEYKLFFNDFDCLITAFEISKAHFSHYLTPHNNLIVLPINIPPPRFSLSPTN